jgi:nucleoside-triphosphatase
MARGVVRVLLTGLPGCGKTTAVRGIAEKLAGVKVAGFYTEEIRVGGVRKGFKWKRLDGAEGVLAHVDIKSAARVGKYGVDVAGFERDVVEVIEGLKGEAKVFIIDEIGKMECLSAKFIELMRGLFQAEVDIVATVARKGGAFMREVREYPGVREIELTQGNQGRVVSEVAQQLMRGS